MAQKKSFSLDDLAKAHGIERKVEEKKKIILNMNLKNIKKETILLQKF